MGMVPKSMCINPTLHEGGGTECPANVLPVKGRVNRTFSNSVPACTQMVNLKLAWMLFID